MNNVKRIKRSVLATVLAIFAMWLVPSAAVFAHGGEDHGSEKAPVVSTSANMMVRTARVGDLEVTVKHPPIEPDKETTARVFVTRFASNEPIEKASVTLLFNNGSAPVEAAAAVGNTAGMYEAKVPPMLQGQYNLAARVEAGGVTETVEYGMLQVALTPVSAAESQSSWARTALIVLGSLVGLGIAGVVIYRTAQLARRNRAERETATA